MKQLLRLQLQVLDAPTGVALRLQRGTHELVPPVAASVGLLLFELQATVAFPKDEAAPRLGGPAVHGPVQGRFLYVNAGTYAGQADSGWARRAKVPLPALTRELVEQALARPDLTLQARILGRAGDGGPACASVKLLDTGWTLAPAWPVPTAQTNPDLVAT
ncbi:hypothetical protein J7E24_15895 [Hymenobacter sp. ISL-91]|uniref:DUF5990 family protein n=1 Tax=Hymenobacter sp. ISL-91 TaxID=2819151 RepID=UPI001BE6997A|nr:DUF5990 family protein [Hymenobacter sp. ISL-91]MBT2559271.1 hypothetical protein [Hymenobacter sp. ISL-91]